MISFIQKPNGRFDPHQSSFLMKKNSNLPTSINGHPKYSDRHRLGSQHMYITVIKKKINKISPGSFVDAECCGSEEDDASSLRVARKQTLVSSVTKSKHFPISILHTFAVNDDELATVRGILFPLWSARPGCSDTFFPLQRTPWICCIHPARVNEYWRVNGADLMKSDFFHLADDFALPALASRAAEMSPLLKPSSEQEYVCSSRSCL